MLRRDALADLSGSIRTMPECLMRSKYFYGLIGLISFYRIQRATIVLFLLSHTTHSFLVVPVVTDRLPIDVCLMTVG